MNAHTSVLLKEAVAALAINKDGIYIDATFGRGGHSRAILNELGKHGRLIAIDKDENAVNYATQTFADDQRFTVVHSSFAQLKNVALANNVCGKVNGILLDLGVSSPQLDDASRGFSFMQDGPLDMRMDKTQELTAAKWLATVSAEDLADVLYQYGEERYSRKIAAAIVKARDENPISTTLELANIIKEAHPKWEQHKHPATRSFQAIRIFINQELNDIEQVLQQSLDVLEVSGRLAVISFHSLEDRLVKQFIKANSKGPEVPRYLPLPNETFKPRLKKHGKAIKPSATEVKANVRSRSAVLRVVEKVT